MTAPVVIAHRGASAAHPPGNTVEAFHGARALGAAWVEFDVRRTVDGAAVVHHDAELPDGRLLAALRSAEVPAWVPGLSEALDACDGLGVNIEIKNLPTEPDFDPDESLADLVAGLDDRPGQPRLVSSFHLPTIERVRQLRPDLPTGLLTIRLRDKDVARAVAGGHRAIHPHHLAVDPGSMRRAEASGLEVNVWTVDEAEEMCRLADLGVAGIVTNVPDVAVALFA